MRRLDEWVRKVMRIRTLKSAKEFVLEAANVHLHHDIYTGEPVGFDLYFFDRGALVRVSYSGGESFVEYITSKDVLWESYNFEVAELILEAVIDLADEFERMREARK